MKNCIVEWCWKHGRSKWLCSTHYSRSRKWTDLLTPIRWEQRHAIIEWSIAKIPVWLNAKDWFAIVDKDFAWLDKHNWSLWTTWYARATIGLKNHRMHQIIIGKVDKPFVIDHINRDKLDNRIENLRIVTETINNFNKAPRENKSWVTWVHLSKSGNRNARIWYNKSIILLGTFDTKEEAIAARNRAMNLYYWYKAW